MDKQRESQQNQAKAFCNSKGSEFARINSCVNILRGRAFLSVLGDSLLCAEPLNTGSVSSATQLVLCLFLFSVKFVISVLQFTFKLPFLLSHSLILLEIPSGLASSNLKEKANDYCWTSHCIVSNTFFDHRRVDSTTRSMPFMCRQNKHGRFTIMASQRNYAQVSAFRHDCENVGAFQNEFLLQLLFHRLLGRTVANRAAFLGHRHRCCHCAHLITKNKIK